MQLKSDQEFLVAKENDKESQDLASKFENLSL